MNLSSRMDGIPHICGKTFMIGKKHLRWENVEQSSHFRWSVRLPMCCSTFAFMLYMWKTLKYTHEDLLILSSESASFCSIRKDSTFSVDLNLALFDCEWFGFLGKSLALSHDLAGDLNERRARYFRRVGGFCSLGFSSNPSLLRVVFRLRSSNLAITQVASAVLLVVCVDDEFSFFGWKKFLKKILLDLPWAWEKLCVDYT